MSGSRVIITTSSSTEYDNLLIYCNQNNLPYDVAYADDVIHIHARPANPTPESQYESRSVSPTGAVIQEPLLFKPDKEHRGFWGAEFLAKGYLSLSNAEVRLRNYANTYNLATATGFYLDSELKEMFNTDDSHVTWSGLRGFLARSMLIA